MNISIFDVVGPVMIGPSSSHTAGATRLARVALGVTSLPFHHVSFGLHGSFAKTYKGHGTDRALVAGVLGLHEADERIAAAFSLAAERGITYDFHEVELDGVHENTVQITFSQEDGGSFAVVGSSIGGGQIVISRVNGFDVMFSAVQPTLLIVQQDKRGVVSDVSRILAESGINIGVMRLSRNARGETAVCVIETDDGVDTDTVERIRSLVNVLSVQSVNIGSEEG